MEFNSNETNGALFVAINEIVLRAMKKVGAL
jgi:hypothetical protein